MERGEEGHHQISNSRAPVLSRFASFNIRYANSGDRGNLNWSSRAKRVAALLRFHRIELVGLQEALKEQLDDLKKFLPDYRFIGTGRDGDNNGEFSAIGFMPSIYRLLDQGTFWLSETPHVPASRSWDTACVRICTWGEFVHPPSGRRVWLFNTHLDHRSKLARANGLKVIIQQMALILNQKNLLINNNNKGNNNNNNNDNDNNSNKEGNENDEEEDIILVTGDFNMEEEDNSFDTFLENEEILKNIGNNNISENLNNINLRFCFARHICEEPPYGCSGTFTGWEKRNLTEPGSLIDHIFIRRKKEIQNDTRGGEEQKRKETKQSRRKSKLGEPIVKVQRYGILPDHFDGQFISDHRPVVVDILL